MHSATRLDDLKILECFLQNALHAHLGRIVPFRVQCLYKDDTLWVLAQHPADVTIDIPDTFGVLERTLQAEEPKTPLVVKMYLRAEGSQKPYSQHGFTVYPLVKKTVPGEAAPAMAGMSEDRQALERDRHDLAAGKPLHIQDDSDDSMDNSDITPSTVSEIILHDSDLSGGRSDRLVKIDTESFVSDIEHSFGATKDNDFHTTYPAASKKRKNKLLPILGGLGVLAIGSGSAYMGTRPCVFSTCTELSTATQLTQSALVTLKNPNVSGAEVLTAQKQLTQSVEALSSIPAWAGSYGTAQNSLQTTAPLATDVNLTVAAMNKAYAAAKLVQNPPIPLSIWQQSKQMWTESIASLGAVRNNSQIYPLVQQKLTDYRGKLAAIDRRIQAEITAEQNLKSAVEGIGAATKSQSEARDLAEWRQVKSQWDKVTTQLGSIPASVTVYPQAQELLKSKQPLIATAQEKVVEEDKAAQNYQTAVKLAAAAKLSQKNNQLPQAVSQWNQAVVAIQSIPQNSTVYNQAKPLVFEYTKSFQKVESQLKNTQTIATATKDLQRTCAGNPQICSFTVSAKTIVVRLMPLYTQTVKQTAVAASTQGDRSARAGILNHVNTLGNALQTIGDNAKLPIELYGADGKQIQNYRPQG
jgi:hypothetical protein